jgi:hypothetical protein
VRIESESDIGLISKILGFASDHASALIGFSVVAVSFIIDMICSRGEFGDSWQNALSGTISYLVYMAVWQATDSIWLAFFTSLGVGTLLSFMFYVLYWAPGVDQSVAHGVVDTQTPHNGVVHSQTPHSQTR